MAKRGGYLRRSGRNSQLLETVYSHRVVPVGNGLDIEHLVMVLAEALPEFCPNQELVQMAREKARYLTRTYGQSHHKQRQPSLSDDDLEDVAMILEDFLGSTEALPPTVVAYVHTYIGLVRQYQERYSSAIVSLLRALWIRKSAHDEPDRLAVSCHRLGLVYGLAGDFEQAKSLLDRAILYYEQAHIAKDHHFVVGAKRSLEHFQQKKAMGSEEFRVESHASSKRALHLRSRSEGDRELLLPELW